MYFIDNQVKKNRYILLALLLLFIIITLFKFQKVLLPFALAAFLSFIFDPIISWISSNRLTKFKIPRWVAVGILYVLLGFILYVFVQWSFPQIGHELLNLGGTLKTLLRQLPQEIESATLSVKIFLQQNGFPHEWIKPQDIIEDQIPNILSGIRSRIEDFVGIGKNIIASLIGSIFKIFLVLMVTSFLLIDRDKILQFILSLVPVEFHKHGNDIMKQLSLRLSGVVRGQILICIVNGVLTFIGLFVFNIKLKFILALVACLFSLIPIFGSILSTLPIVFIAVGQSVVQGLLIMLWIVGIHLIEANYLNPKIIGNNAKIHPVLVVFVLIAGEFYYGIVGALLAVPVTSILLTFFVFFYRQYLSIQEKVEQP